MYISVAFSIFTKLHSHLFFYISIEEIWFIFEELYVTIQVALKSTYLCFVEIYQMACVPWDLLNVDSDSLRSCESFYTSDCSSQLSSVRENTRTLCPIPLSYPQTSVVWSSFLALKFFSSPWKWTQESLTKMTTALAGLEFLVESVLGCQWTCSSFL